MVLLLAVTVYGGYVFPLVGLTMSWRQWLRSRAAATAIPSNWRRIVTIAFLVSVTTLIPLWSYAAVRELRNDYSDIWTSAQIGRWSSLGLFVISLFAEGKVRRYLLVGAIGLLFFFGVTIGELP